MRKTVISVATLVLLVSVLRIGLAQQNPEKPKAAPPPTTAQLDQRLKVVEGLLTQFMQPYAGGGKGRVMFVTRSTSPVVINARPGEKVIVDTTIDFPQEPLLLAWVSGPKEARTGMALDVTVDSVLRGPHHSIRFVVNNPPPGQTYIQWLAAY